jgi:triosephosphate isomerase
VKKKIVAANWKMNLTHKEVKPYLDRFLAKVGEINEVQVVFIPSFTSIPAFADALEESPNFFLARSSVPLAIQFSKSGRVEQ